MIRRSYDQPQLDEATKELANVLVDDIIELADVLVDDIISAKVTYKQAEEAIEEALRIIESQTRPIREVLRINPTIKFNPEASKLGPLLAEGLKSPQSPES